MSVPQTFGLHIPSDYVQSLILIIWTTGSDAVKHNGCDNSQNAHGDKHDDPDHLLSVWIIPPTGKTKRDGPTDISDSVIVRIR